uniref:DAO domain-containing protein n=1 Tax=Macrostomum lignano TaxID=282301 RepID=A0A1I8F0Z4_9PLAT
VVGAGLVGASVALQAQSALPPGSSVTIIADAFNAGTTSWVAAGAFRVESVEELSPDSPDRAERWCRDSLPDWPLARPVPRAGVAPLPIVQVAREPPPRRRYAYSDMAPGGCRELTPEELLTQFPDWPGGLGFGIESLSVLADPRLYLPWLLDQFLAAGGRIERRRVASLEEAGAGADLVFNCAGLEAGRLAGGDPAVHPVRGQVARVRAPWLKRGFYGPDSTYAYPSAARVTWPRLAASAGDYCLTARESDAADIRTRAVRLLPGLAAAFADSDGRPGATGATSTSQPDFVGLRPARHGGIRVAAEGYAVHCYGHGGHGVALSWGTAAEAVELGLARLDGGAKL